MKRILTFLVGGAMMILGAACSSDDEPNKGTENRKIEATIVSPKDLDGKLDDKLLSELLDGSRNCTLHRDTTVFYDLPKGWDHWYEDTGIWFGRGCINPYTITFQDGEVYTPIQLFHSSGYCIEFDILWNVYEIATRKHFNFYCRGAIEKNLLLRHINIDDIELYIHSFSGKDFVLSNTSEYAGGLHQNGGHTLEVSYYNFTDDTLNLGGKDIVFDSHKECLQYILDKCREQFGDEVDVNKIFTDRILTRHIYNFDEIAKIYGLE